MSTPIATAEPSAENDVEGLGLLLQAHGLLTVLLRHHGGEVEETQRRSPADVLRTISVAARALDEGITIPPESANALSKQAASLAQDALTVLRMVEVSSFIRADDSISGMVEQAHSDDVVVNAVWLASETLDRATSLSPCV